MEGACPGRPPPAWSRGVNELRSTAWCRRPRSRWPVVPEPARTAPRPRAVTGAPLPGTARTPATASMGGAGQPGRLRWRRAQQTPEGVLGQTELADVDGVFGDRVELRGVAAKPTLVRQGVSDIVNQNLGGIWVQWPKPQAGEGANEAVKPIHTQSETRLVARHNSPSAGCFPRRLQRPASWAAKGTALFVASNSYYQGSIHGRSRSQQR